MVLLEQRPGPSFGDILPCADFTMAYVSQICECTSGLAGVMRDRLCPWCVRFSAFGCDEIFDRILLGLGIVAAFIWLALPTGAYEGWLCGYGMLVLSLTCFSLWRALRECVPPSARAFIGRAHGWLRAYLDTTGTRTDTARVLPSRGRIIVCCVSGCGCAPRLRIRRDS